MKLKFIPKMHRPPMALTRRGDVLTIDGEDFDFAGLPPGATLPRDAVSSPRIARDVERDHAGELVVTLYLPHGEAAPRETRYPDPLKLMQDGPVDLPAYDVEPEQ